MHVIARSGGIASVISKCLGTVTLKVLVGDPVPIPGQTQDVYSYAFMHGPFACYGPGGKGSFLAPRRVLLANFIEPPKPSDIVVKGGVWLTGDLPTSLEMIGTPAGYEGDALLGVTLNGAITSYDFSGIIAANPILTNPPLSFATPSGFGLGNNTPTKTVGWASFGGPVSNILACNVFNDYFYLFTPTGFVDIPNAAIPSSLPVSGLTFAVKENNFFGNNGYSYATSAYWIGDLFGGVEQFLFDDATLNVTLPLSISAQGLGYGVIAEDSSGNKHNLLIAFDGREYLKLNFDITAPAAQGLASGTGQNFFAALDGLFYYGDNMQAISNTGAQYYWHPLYATALLPYPPPFNFAFAPRSLLSPHCCPTGDGHR